LLLPDDSAALRIASGTQMLFAVCGPEHALGDDSNCPSAAAAERGHLERDAVEGEY